MPAVQSHDFLTPVRGKRLIKAKQYTDRISKNIIDNQVTNNSKCFRPVRCNSDNYRYSFFPRTIIDWNYLDEDLVRAKTVDSFRKAVHHWD